MIEEFMKHTLSFSRIVFSAALIGAGFSNAVADETIRDLAKERHRFIGTILNSEWFNDAIEPEFEEIHKTQFNVVVAENEMKFDATEPRENEFNFTKGDKMVEYAQANGLRVRGHALAWHSQVPGWVNNYSGQKEKLLSVLKNHIDNVVGHWKGKIAEWDVVNEAINDDYNHDWRSTGSVWYEGIGPEFLDSAFVWAHAADPDAELCYNDYAVEWGINEGSKAGFVLEQVKRWKANGIPITCVGTQTHIEIAHETTPQNVRAFAKALAELDVTLNITELDIGFPKGSAGKLTAADYEKQGHLYRQFMDVFLEEPNMGEFVIWGLTDAHSWLDEQQGKTEGLLYDKQYKPKPAYDSIMVSLKAHPASEVKSPYPDSLFDAPCDGNCGDSSEAIKSIAGTSTLSMYLSGRTLSIAGATAAKVNVFDVQGRPVFSAKNVKKAVELSGLSEGLFVVRVRDGSKSLMQRITIY
jgi:endo-1,4-beta-xylanase